MNYRPYLSHYYWYIAKFDEAGNRIPMSGMSTAFTYQYEALTYANSINRVNGYPLASLTDPSRM